jgi:3,4-dihydroxy-2-butanone 4-phosphate synthase
MMVLHQKDGREGRNDLVRATRKSEETRNVCLLLRDCTGVVTQNMAFRVITDLKT